jgi:GNAT superfamily N-acetyltransferase
MDPDPLFRCRTLGAQDAIAYRLSTFAALEPLLQSAGTAGTIAVGLESEDGLMSAGLALGAIHADGGATLSSFFVRPAWRGRRLGQVLHAGFVQACRARGVHELAGTYMSGQDATPALEALLARCGWSVPQPSMLVVHASLESIRHAPWIRAYPLPPGMEIVRWLDVTPSERDALLASDARQPWIAPDLRPFDHETACEPHTSLALRHQGEIIGWVINHQVGEVLRYTCSFMHPRHQRLGRILLLYNEAVARMPAAGFSTGMWTVPMRHAGMVAFARRWMAPHATRFCETRKVRLAIGIAD